MMQDDDDDDDNDDPMILNNRAKNHTSERTIVPWTVIFVVNIGINRECGKSSLVKDFATFHIFFDFDHIPEQVNFDHIPEQVEKLKLKPHPGTVR